MISLFLAFKIIAENQDRSWLRLETELENVTLVFLPKFLWAGLLSTLHYLVLLQFPSFWNHLHFICEGWFPEHRLLQMNYYLNITAVSTFRAIQLPIIIFLVDNIEILNSSILLK